jgi:hypothetical protein
MVQCNESCGPDSKHLGLFLVCEEADVLPAMLQPRAKFTLKLVHSTNSQLTVEKGTQCHITGVALHPRTYDERSNRFE